MQQKTKYILITLLLTGGICFAQIGSPDGPPLPGAPTPEPTLPVDGGVLLLLAAGTFYGIKKSLEK